jgi:hypothetical protein
MAGVAQMAERLAVNQIVAGSSPVTRPDLLGSGAIGSAAVFEIAGCRFDPYLPSLFCACSSVGSSARSITVRSQVRTLPGALKLWGVGVVG